MTAVLILAAVFVAVVVFVLALITRPDDRWQARADERAHDQWVAELAGARAADTDAWIAEYNTSGVIYPDLDPAVLAEEFERLVSTIERPVPADLAGDAASSEPATEAGTGLPLEPTVVLPPQAVMVAALAPHVADALLSQMAAEADCTFVRQLLTVPRAEVAGLFDRPRALPAGVS